MIEVEHREYKIRYSENKNEWQCYELGVEAESLAAAKAGIDKVLLKLRKDSAIDLLFISQHGGKFECRAIDARRIDPRKTAFNTPGWNYEIGVMVERGGRSRPGKRFERAGDLALPTPEVFAAVEHAEAMDAKAKEAKAAADEAWAAVPRITEKDVAGLIQAATQKVEE